MTSFVDYIRALFATAEREEGQTMAEYGVMLAVITSAIVVAIATLSGSVVQLLERVAAIVPQ